MVSQVSVYSMLHRPGASDCHLPKWQKGFFQKGDQGWIVTVHLTQHDEIVCRMA